MTYISILCPCYLHHAVPGKPVRVERLLANLGYGKRQECAGMVKVGAVVTTAGAKLKVRIQPVLRPERCRCSSITAFPYCNAARRQYLSPSPSVWSASSFSSTHRPGHASTAYCQAMLSRACSQYRALWASHKALASFHIAQTSLHILRHTMHTCSQSHSYQQHAYTCL